MMEMEMNAELERDGGSEDAEQSSEGSSAGTVFCTLEQDYAKLIKEMKNNEALAPYEEEYTRLFESLYKAHRNENELTEKCKLLQEEVMQYVEKIDELETNLETNEQTIAKLKHEITNSMKLADAAHSREQNAQEIIENLRGALKKFKQELNQKDKLASEQVTLMNKQKEGLGSDRDKFIGEIETLRERLKATTKYNSELEIRSAELENQRTEIQENLDAQLNEYSKEHRLREKAEETIQQLQEEIKKNINELQTINSSLKTMGSHATKLEFQLKDQKLTNETLQQEINKLLSKKLNIQLEFDNLNIQYQNNEKKLSECERKVDMMKIEIQKMRDENSKLKTEKEQLSKKIMKEENLKSTAQDNLKQTQISHRNAELEIYSLQKFLEEEKKIKEKIIREKEANGKAVAGLKETIKSLQMEANINEQIRRKMELTIEDAGQNAEELKRKIFHLEKERDKYCHEAQELFDKVEDHIDDLKIKRTEISDFKKRLYEAESKLRQQHNAYETLKGENNSQLTNLSEAKDEIRELKQKLKVTNKQVEQLKEEVALKEVSITNGEFLLGKAEKEKEELKSELQKSFKTVSMLKQKIEEMKNEEKHLRLNENHAQMKINRQKKENDAVLVERDVLGTQLVRRNDEISLLYNKIRVLEDIIQRGENQYAQRLEEIRLFKLEVQKLRSEKILLIKNINNTSDLKFELVHMQQDLTREKLKVTALEEELQNPSNIHRWRKLEGTDPDMFEMLKKVQILQKRIIKMSSQLIVKEKTIEYTEKLYTNVREILGKQPGSEMTEMLSKTRKALIDRSNKIKKETCLSP
ncbi:cilia- and flagella-associated protein 58-like isoform X2 [Leptopilina boulardi]|uniref:cilia- and flagella-associated protein 58-like isoform X2 n=1 Tax=Leptopilina boulardi TaxID=63433 RepID=UPI0021F51DC9|nr:cilia- and flagella-associated protein 58-like isoform X2 [Leptopilina boulardi]